MNAVMKWAAGGAVLLGLLSGCGNGNGNQGQPGPDALSSQVVTPYNGPDLACTQCHAPGSALDPVLLGGSGTAGKHTPHVSQRDLPCTKCHFDYYWKPTHMNGRFDVGEPGVSVVYFDATNPNGQWADVTGPHTGSCVTTTCHGGSRMDWYGTASWTLPPCAACHSGFVATRRTVLSSIGDFGLDPARISHHVAGSADPTPEQCRVCHAMDQHMGGTVRLRQADTDAAIAYDPATPATLEPFCLSCHDADGASATFVTGGSALSPFNDGEVLGSGVHIAGNKIAGYWNNTYTVHKDNGLTCKDCHGLNGAVNMHGSDNKGLLTNTLALPVPPRTAPNYYEYNYDNYKLCFDCHESYPSVSKEVVLGYKQGGNYDVYWAPTPYPTDSIKTLYRDRYISNSVDYPSYWGGISPFYNDTIWGDAFTPLHNYHLLGYDGGMMANVWTYRSGEVGGASCVTCHNVHGTSGTVRSVYDEFGIVVGTNGPDQYGTLVNYTDATLKNYPINCAVSCHGMVGSTSYWNTPSGE